MNPDDLIYFGTETWGDLRPKLIVLAREILELDSGKCWDKESFAVVSHEAKPGSQGLEFKMIFSYQASFPPGTSIKKNHLILRGAKVYKSFPGIIAARTFLFSEIYSRPLATVPLLPDLSRFENLRQATAWVRSNLNFYRWESLMGKVP